jgi:hypothetical protein
VVSIFLAFPQYPICILFLHIRATCPAYFILLDFIILIIVGEGCKLRSSSLYSLLQPPVTSSLFGPNIILNTLSPCSFLNIRNQVQEQYLTTGNHHHPCALWISRTIIRWLYAS